jgi:membrane protease YdiL (CAAX protease family)
MEYMEKELTQPEQNVLSKVGNWLERKPGKVVELALLSIVVILSFFQPVGILVLVGLSLWLRRKPLKDIGMALPKRAWLTATLALVISFAWAAIDGSFFSPAVENWLGQPRDLSALSAARVSAAGLAAWLVINWTIVAFGEEIIYRGYFIHRFADLFGDTKLGWAGSLLVSSVLFGFAHGYQGLTGMIETFYFGLFLSIIYLINHRNLWLTILVHGMGNTLGFLAIYTGWKG